VGCDISAAFRSIGVDVDTFDDAWVTAILPERIGSFEDFRACRLKVTRQALRGKNPPGR